jgi:GDP-4-dehydro-6-deoxy-D-mannose reductase
MRAKVSTAKAVPMRVIVTGASGFIGWHTIEALVRRDDAVEAWVRRPMADGWDMPVDTALVDVTDADAVAAGLRRFAPDAVIHLAAQSYPGRSWQEPGSTYHVNVLGAINLLEGARVLECPPRILVAGSSAEYAEPSDGRPISEFGPTLPDSPYGASKLAVDSLVQLYGRRYSLDLVRFRPFFLAGPRKTGDVSSDFARRIVAIERGAVPTLRVGALDVVRDIIDVRDGVTAILQIMDAGEAGEVYNVCGGIGVSIRRLLETYRTLSTAAFAVAEDQDLIRPLDQMAKIGDPSKLSALGWSAVHALEDTLDVILRYWRERPAEPAS